ncbi:MAG TPA: threonine/serine dehydratase [Streptosporangiaceae bacterium]|jgi:threonine dehydratase
MADLVSLTAIESAAERISGRVLRTPLVHYCAPTESATRLLVKAENLQRIGAFKQRGAFAKVSGLSTEERARGVVAHSSGNHAQAVAYAAHVLGVAATIVIPDNAPEMKVAATERWGATVVRCAPSTAARLAACQEISDATGAVPVPPYDDPDVIAGQGTLGLEIADDAPDTDVVLVPISGGGLISGVAAAVKARLPHVKVVGVEPALAADARDSLRAGRVVAWDAADTARTMADGLRVERVGALPFAHIQAYVDDIVTVTEDEIRAAVRELATGARLVAEPSGAVATAAYLYRRDELPAGRTYVSVLSGGNIAAGRYAGLLGDAG